MTAGPRLSPIEGYLDTHRDQPATIAQLADATGEDERFVRAFLTAALERGWVIYVPGCGWQLPALNADAASA